MNPTQGPQGQNPYASILQRMQQGGQGQGGGMPPSSPIPQMAVGGGAQAPQQAPAQQGGAGQAVQPGGGTKLLVSALQALNQFISAAGADPQEVTVVRSLITLLSNLITRDQARAHMMSQGQPTGTTTTATLPTGGQAQG